MRAKINRVWPSPKNNSKQKQSKKQSQHYLKIIFFSDICRPLKRNSSLGFSSSAKDKKKLNYFFKILFLLIIFILL